MSEIASILSKQDAQELREIFGTRVKFDEATAPYVWWRIGGPADAFVTAETNEELEKLFAFLRRRRMSFFLLGNGSNILIGDGGLRGVVVKLGGKFTETRFVDAAGNVVGPDDETDDRIRIEAGGAASLAALVGAAASRGAIGIDGLAGIPATVGGAVRMNAGTKTEIGAYLQDITVQTISRSQPHDVRLSYYYRRSTLAPTAIVTGARLAFDKGDAADVRAELQARLVRRKATQPVAQPNAGSCFRNPPGDTAGRLIEAIGAKGWTEGGAMVSPIHANFIVNTGDASAEDVAILFQRIRAEVYKKFMIELEPEVHFIGTFTSREAQAIG